MKKLELAKAKRLLNELREELNRLQGEAINEGYGGKVQANLQIGIRFCGTIELASLITVEQVVELCQEEEEK